MTAALLAGSTVVAGQNAAAASDGSPIAMNGPWAGCCGGLYAHEWVTFNIGVQNSGNTTVYGLVVSYFVDGSPLGTNNLPPIWPGGWCCAGSDSWQATAGTHSVEAALTGPGQPTLTGFYNFTVGGNPDLSVSLNVTKVWLKTDNGNPPANVNPTEQMVIKTTVCNVAAYPMYQGDGIQTSVSANSATGSSGSQSLNFFYVQPLVSGACVTNAFSWYAYQYVGDITITSQANYDQGDVNQADKSASVETFVLAGGAGGVYLGAGSGTPGVPLPGVNGISVNPTGDAYGSTLAVSGTGNAYGNNCYGTISCVTVSGTGNAQNWGDWNSCGTTGGSVSVGCVAVSGRGNASNQAQPYSCGSVQNGMGVAIGCIAVTGTGSATNDAGWQACGTSSGNGGVGVGCLAASGTGPALNNDWGFPNCGWGNPALVVVDVGCIAVGNAGSGNPSGWNHANMDGTVGAEVGDYTIVLP
ncbi:MAG: hypothetical protein ACYDDF_01285 [Thermoplasmatota archaeon]